MKILGRNHPDVAMTLNNLAVLCQAQERFGEADRLFQPALAIFERAFGPNDPRVAVCRCRSLHVFEHFRICFHERRRVVTFQTVA